MMPLPTELGTCAARGSIRSCPPALTLYFWPARAPATSTDQFPFPSETSGLAASLQALKSPATKTSGANGAQTRNVPPPGYGVAPMPGRADGVGMLAPGEPEGAGA